MIPDTADAGAERQARYLIQALARSSAWDVEIVYFRKGPAHQQFVELGVPLLQISAHGSSPLALLERAYGLVRAYWRRPPAILHTWLFEANFAGAIAARAWPGTSLIVSQRSGNLERETPRVLRASRVIRSRADHVISNSAEGFALLSQLGFDPRRMSIVGNGFPQAVTTATDRGDARARARAGLRIEPEAPLVGYVGRADPAKDLDTLFNALALVWERLPSAKLILIGPASDDLSRFSVARPDAVQTLGWVSDAVRLMPAFDVLVSSSWTEGHSNSVCEALLAGVPVACTATGDHVGVVQRAGGKVVPIRRPDALADAVLDLLRAPPEPDFIARTAAASLSIDQVVEATTTVYLDCVARRDRALPRGSGG